MVGPVTPGTLGRTWGEVDCRFDVYKATDGAHIDVYYAQKMWNILIHNMYHVSKTLHSL